MEHIIGYGFDAGDLSAKELVGFIRENAPESYESMMEDILGKGIPSSAELSENEKELLEGEAEEWILTQNDSVALFIASAINEKEGGEILSCADHYVIYDSVVFPGEYTGRRPFDTRYDFGKMIGKYFPYAACGMIGEGSSFFDPSYWME
jgi:hypothetical protein